MNRILFLYSFLALSTPLLAAAPAADQSAFARALETAISIPAFRTSLLSRISTVDSLSAQPAPSLSEASESTARDPYRAEAALLVGAMVAQPEIMEMHPAEIRSALGEKAASQLDEAATRLQARAAGLPKLAAQLQRFRQSLDLNDVDSMQEFSARLNAQFDGSAPRTEKAPAAAVQTPRAASPKKIILPKVRKLQPAKDLAPLPSGPLPTTKYAASIQTDAKGQRSVWIRIPPSASNPQEQFYSLGPIATIKKGTILFHWGGQEIDSIIAAGKVGANVLNKQIIQDSGSTDDLWGGGFYMSSLLADSASFGAKGIYTTLDQDMEVLTTGAFPPPNRVDFVLAIKNAGMDAFQESPHPSWFNVIQPKPLSAGFKELDFQTAIRALRAEEPAQAAMDLLMFDQRYPVSLSHWPSDLCTPLRNLLAGRPLSDPDQALLTGTVGRAATSFLMMKARSNGQIKTTPLFKAFDQFVKQTMGSSLLDM